MGLKHLKALGSKMTYGIYYCFKVYGGGGHYKKIKHLMAPTWFITKTIK